LVDGEAGAYGVSFPDLPGCVAMGRTVDEALLNAEESLRDWAGDYEARGGAMPAPTPLEEFSTPPGTQLVSVPLIRLSGRRTRLNVYVDEDVAAFIDDEARRRKMTRTSALAWIVRRVAQMGG
jgi:predicted RNase H-like HicB family nuclease